MAAKKSAKKTAASKTTPEKKARGKRAASADEANAGSEPAEPAGAESGTPASRAADAERAEKQPEGEVSSMSVNLGHVFSLRPRVSKTFRKADFLTARQLLQDEEYADMEEAARAVAEKALELTRKGPPKRGFKPGR
jgi:hypothetical protein